MSRRLNLVLLRLSRWPRRIAALVCLLLAAASALTPADGSTPVRAPARADPIGSGLRAGEVAVPITATAPSASMVHVGAHIGVYGAVDERAGPRLLADRLRVLAIDAGDDLGGQSPVIVVAAGPTAAGHLAAAADQALLVVMDRSP